MPKYKITVTFDRKNPVTKKLEKKAVREGIFYSTDRESAKESYLKIFKQNEPDRRKIHKVEVTVLA